MLWTVFGVIAAILVGGIALMVLAVFGAIAYATIRDEINGY